MNMACVAVLIANLPRGNILQAVGFQSVLGAALVVAVGILLIRYVSKVTEALSIRSPGARFVLKWTEQVTRLIVSFATIFTALLVLAPSSDAFIAGIGSAAIAVALGAQDLVKNLVGGLVILTDRPYQLGDHVQIGDTTGEVVHIGLRSTKLQTSQDSMVTVSNSDLLNGQVSNDNCGVPECQVITTIYVPTDTDPDELVRLGHEAAWCCPYLKTERPVVVLLSDEYSETPFMQLRIKAYVFDHRYIERMQADITARVKKHLGKMGILANWKTD